MRKLLFFGIAATLVPSFCLAQESVAERLLSLSRQANDECRKAQLPGPALDAACQSGQAYDRALEGLGFCFDPEGGEWRGCGQAARPSAAEDFTGRPSAEEQSGPAGGLPDEEAGDAPAPTARATSPEAPESYAAPPLPEGEEPLPPLEQAMPGNDEAPDQSARDPGGPDDFEAQEPGEEWAQAEPGRWRTYRNSRFGTVAQIPAFAFEPAIAINGGDGQTFTARDRQSEIAVYGTLLDSQPFGEYRDWYRSELSGISYEAGGRNWFVLSGIAEGRIYYVKVLRSQGCGVDIAHHVVLRYPVASKREFDPLVERLAGSLRGATPQSLCRQ